MQVARWKVSTWEHRGRHDGFQVKQSEEASSTLNDEQDFDVKGGKHVPGEGNNMSGDDEVSKAYSFGEYQ